MVYGCQISTPTYRRKRRHIPLTHRGYNPSMAHGASLRNRVQNRVQVVDSHTAGEPTRLVIAGGPPLDEGSLQSQLERLRSRHDSFRRAVLWEPRGSEVLVGAPAVSAPGPCGGRRCYLFQRRGLSGHVRPWLYRSDHHAQAPWAYRARHASGLKRRLDRSQPRSIRMAQFPSPTCPAIAKAAATFPSKSQNWGTMHGDIAWGGNWFFLVADHNLLLRVENRAR